MVSHKVKDKPKGEHRKGFTKAKEGHDSKGVEQTEGVDEYLKSIYYDLSKPGSYGGLNKLWLAIKKSKDKPEYITRKSVAKWLDIQQVHRLHQTPKHHFKTESISVGQIDEQWDCDLISMIPQSKNNKGYKYIALFVDLFSKHLWLEPLKTKQSVEVTNMVQKVFAEGRKPGILRTDQGSI
jgi:hypothetical protein